jgi:peroxiredoxin
MRKALLPLAVACVALAVTIAVFFVFAPPALRVRAGDPAPDFALPHYNQPGSRGTLRELRGSPVLLVRFDSHWPGSVVYLAELEAVHRRFLRDGLVIVGVALDPAVEQRALEFVLANRSVTFTVLLDPEGRATNPLYGVARGRAETYVIDPGGRVLAVHLEPQKWTSQPLRERLAALLPVRTPTPQPLDTPRPGG